MHAEPKIPYFHSVLPIDKDIVRLEIAMNDVMIVNVIDSFQDLSEQPPDFIDIIRKPFSDQIANGLSIISRRRNKNIWDTYMLLAILHLHIQGDSDRLACWVDSSARAKLLDIVSICPDAVFVILL